MGGGPKKNCMWRVAVETTFGIQSLHDGGLDGIAFFQGEGSDGQKIPGPTHVVRVKESICFDASERGGGDYSFQLGCSLEAVLELSVHISVGGKEYPQVFARFTGIISVHCYLGVVRHHCY